MSDAKSTMSEASLKRRGRFLFLPLGLTFFVAHLLTVLPLAVVAFFALETLLSGGTFPTFVSNHSSDALSYRGLSVHLYSVYVFALATLGALLGFLASEVFFIARLRFLLRWVKSREKGALESVPVPDFGPDEIGELGRQVALALVHFTQTEEKGRDLTDQKTQFLTATAHQLRTPLTELLWSFESMGDPNTPPESKKQITRDVDSTLKRMRLIINHIIATADIGDDRFGYVFEKISIVEIIDALIVDFAPVSETRDVTIRFDHGSDLFPIYADKERISLAIFNLISNAVDYTPKGGSVVISVKAEEKRLRVSVQDSGIGISATELPLLFTKFYRGDRAKHNRPDGTGLGLFLARNIISRHGSDIQVQSVENRGAQFSFYLDSKKKS